VGEFPLELPFFVPEGGDFLGSEGAQVIQSGLKQKNRLLESTNFLL
jgi:hypothetical protein